MGFRSEANPYMIRIVTEGPVTTITPTRKRLAIPDVELLFLDVVHQVEMGNLHLILDFSEVEWVCATTVGFLLELLMRLRRRGGSLKLCGVSDQMLQLLRMLGIEGRFDIVKPERVLLNAG
jgi:anti-anti-sigma factor